MFKTRWISENIAVCGIPDMYEISLWRESGISAVVNLVEGDLGEQLREEEEKYFEVLHIPTNDFEAPSLAETLKIINWIDAKLKNNAKIVIHCRAGIGRTGTITAAYLIWNGEGSPQSVLDFIEKFNLYPQSEVQMKLLDDIYALKISKSLKKSSSE
mgnify:CR=1 FL=1